MASSSSEAFKDITANHDIFTLHFPEVINREIKISHFLKASSELVRVVEHLGTIFAPIKYDMNGNIEKIRKTCTFDDNSCLIELMTKEVNKSTSPAIEGLLWLNRALLFFELIFQEIITSLQSNNHNVSMKKIYTIGYEGSVKKYHGWVTQQLFSLICKMSPSLLEVLKCFNVNDKIKDFENNLLSYNTALHAVRCRIDEFFFENHLFVVK